MAQYTGVYKLYKPDIDDPNTVYVEGFRNSADKVDEILNTLSTMEVVNPYSSEQYTKKVITDAIALKWQAHIESYTGGEGSITGDVGLYFELNPHKITAGQLYDDNLSDNIGHNAIVKEINNMASTVSIDRSELINWYTIDKTDSVLSDIGASNSDRPHNLLDISSNLADRINKANINSTIDKHVSNEMVFDWETHRQSISGSIDTNLYPEAVVNPHKVKASEIYSEDLSTTGVDALIEELNNATGTSILWTSVDKAGSDLTDIVTRNHDDLQNINSVDYTSSDTTYNKHVNNAVMKGLETHKQSYTLSTEELGGAVNPHKVTVSQLYNDTLVSQGADAVVAEINSNSNITIDWDKVEHSTINIEDIPFRSHQSMQDILPAVVTSSDTTLNRHVSDSQVKKYEEHVDDNDKATANPHNVSAQNLTSSTGVAVGGYAIQTAVNQQGITDGIDWTKVSKAGSDLTDMVTRNHDDLQTINELDPTSADTVKNKHLSNAQAKVWEDHNYTTSGNPHDVTTSEIKGVDFGSGNDYSSSTGGNAIIAELNHNSSELIDWSVINKNSSNITDITTRNHDDMQNVYYVDFGVLDNTKNKHISSIQANKWEVHVDTVDGSNPHNVFASNLKSDRTGVANGGIAIVNAINDYALNSSLLWSKVDKTGSSLSDITFRTHGLLDISSNLVDVSSNSSTVDKHISNLLAKGWEDHRLNVDNPHGVTAVQIGGDSIVNEINSSSTSNLIIGDRIAKNQIKLSELETYSHSELTDILTADDTGSDTTKNRHVSDSQAKNWTDHMNTTTGNPHNVQSDEVPFANGTTSLVATNVESAIKELDYFKSKPNSGPIDYYANRDDVAEFIGNDLVIKANTVLLYDNEHFENSVVKIDMPQTVIPIGTGVNEVPEDEVFYVMASYNGGSATYIVTANLSVANNSNIAPIAFGLIDTVSGVKNIYPMARYADGLSERLLKKLMHVDFNERESGLLLKVLTPSNPDLRFKITQGSVWRGLDRASLAEISSETPDTLIFVYKDNNGDFVYDTSFSGANEDTYQDPDGGLKNYGVGKRGACWIYRSLVEEKIYMMSSNVEYPDIEDARTAQPPTDLPDVITATCIFVGKIITKEGEGEIQEILRPFDIMFTNTSVGYEPVEEHNDMNSIQGGNATERYHLSNAEYTRVLTVEQNADVTDKDNVNSSITNYLTSISADIANLTELQDKAYVAYHDRVKDTGDSMTGKLTMNMAGNALNIGGSSVDGSDVWAKIGNSTYNYSMVYKGSESGTANAFEFWTSNNNAGDGYDTNVNGKVFRIDQNRLFSIYGNTVFNGDVTLNHPIYVNNRMIYDTTPLFEVGSVDSDDYSAIVGNTNKASAVFGIISGGMNGTLALKGYNGGRYGIIRAKASDLLIDAYGDINLNTDTSGSHTTTPRVNVGSSSKISFNPNGKSLFQNGLSIGDTGNTAGAIVDLHGTMAMNNNRISELSDIVFNAGYSIDDNSSSMLTFSSNSASENHLHFDANNVTISKLKFSTTGVEFTDGSDNNSFSIASGVVTLHNLGTAVAHTETYGMDFLSAISIDGIKVEFVNI